MASISSMPVIFTILNVLLLFSASNVHAAFDLGHADDSDLTNFVTRPEIKAPLFNVTVYNADAVTPGYWFVAPYAKILQEDHPSRYYQACQTGPAIYDGAGNLVWSGACLFKNQNTCDFRVSRYNDTDYLSSILYVYGDDKTGHGVVMDKSYNVTNSLYPPKLVMNFNMHELNIVEGGRTALAIIGRSELVDTSELGLAKDVGWVSNMGFREFDIATGENIFEWWALGKVQLSESTVEIDSLEGPHPRAWNFFHMNSVDKNSDGDYVISSRYTNTIYKVSGKDGSILWRLGGANSSFVMDGGLNFSRQHDARFIEQTATTETITLLDNGSDNINVTADSSSALLILLDKSVTPMVAKVIRRWIRPDQQLSKLRGNFQLLPNRNAFVGWSANSYISEHTFDNELVMEARFKSNRFVTYRSYKFNFTGAPIEPPTLKAYVYGISPATSTTVCYVSWNGATEVDTWEFHRGGSDNSATEPSLIGKAKKAGFETMAQFTGYEGLVYARAISADGQVLGESSIETTIRPSTWQSVLPVDGKTGPDANQINLSRPTTGNIKQDTRQRQPISGGSHLDSSNAGVGKHKVSDALLEIYKEEL